MLTDINKALYKSFNGIQVCSDYGAVLGWTPEEGQDFKIAIDGWSYKNFNVTEDSFSGEEIEYNEGVWGSTKGCVLGTSAQGDASPVEYSIPSASANANLRCAIYLTNEGSGQSTWTQLGIRTYNTSTHSYGWAFPFQYTNLDTSLKMFVISMPHSTPPGYVQQMDASPENILGQANTIRGNQPATYAGIYYNLTNIASNVPIFDTL